MFKIGNVEIKNPIVLAPMAGYTNVVFRKIAKQMGVGLVYSEMVSAKGILYDNEKTLEMLTVDPLEHPISIQLFGGEIDDLVKAAQYVDQHTNADIIDFNMGCPVRKVLKSNAGSKLLQNSDYIYDIIKAVTEKVNKPVTIKIRVGWDDNHINCIEIAKKAELAGVSAIAIHGRTKEDLYRGKVNLDYIKMVKESVSIPVIGNGDIKTIEDAIRMKEYTGCDGLMIGRASLGNPWFLRDLVDYFTGSSIQNPPSIQERIAMIKEHFADLIKLKGEKIALLEMRSLAAWYTKGLPSSKDFRKKLITINNVEEFYELVDGLSF